MQSSSTTKEAYALSMEELARLADTAEAEVVDTFVQGRSRPVPATFIGKGKVEEIKAEADRQSVGTLVFNDNLTPAQARNIAKMTHCNVVDRTELILDIFALHARTKQAKCQVELAQLEYNYSKLRNLWQHLSRIQGGIGTRGPGEKQIEVDRREIKKKITILKDQLKVIEKETLVKRSKRSDYLSISLVGYTNAGKSTLFNRLTKEDIYTADKLFATLDATSRALFMEGRENVIVTDTIGFIDKLPHTLVSAFHSTLIEVDEADLLMHVVDISNPVIMDYIHSVENVLKELKVDGKNILMVFNKTDRLKTVQLAFLKKKLLGIYPHAVFISAAFDENLDELTERILYFIEKQKKKITLEVPVALQNIISFLYDNATVHEKAYDEEKGVFRIVATVPREFIPSIERQIEAYRVDHL